MNIEELKAALAKATPGDWVRSNDPKKWVSTLAPGEWRENADNDAALICLLRNHAPELIAAVEERDRLREALAQAATHLDGYDSTLGALARAALETKQAMTATPEEIAGRLSEAQRAVMLEMSNGEYVERASFLAVNAGVPLSETREILRQFRQDGLATHGTLWNEDEAAPAGSGTWLTREGLAVREHLKEMGK